MLYERKRTFGKEPIDLTAVSGVVYAGDLAVSSTSGLAGALDYEEQNQHFPDENTLEIIGWADATSTGSSASLVVVLQSSHNGSNWKDELTITIPEASIVVDALLYRATIPATAGRYMRLKLNYDTEVFTAGEVLALVRPL